MVILAADFVDYEKAVSNPEYVDQIGVNEAAGRCTSCLIPSTVKNIPFNGGTCSLCAACSDGEAAKKAQAMEDGLEDLIEGIRVRGRGAQYDCLLGLSGGRDSTYLAHLLVRKHRLRVLAAYYRTPFTPDVTDQNVRRTVQALGITLINLDIDPKRHADIARKFFLMWLKRPLPELANLTCAECKLVNRELARLAKLHNVRTTVSGGNRLEKVQFLPAARKEGEHAEALWVNMRRMFRIAKRGAGVVRQCPSVLALLPTCVKASVMYINTHTPYMKLRYPEMGKIDVFQPRQVDRDRVPGDDPEGVRLADAAGMPGDVEERLRIRRSEELDVPSDVRRNVPGLHAKQHDPGRAVDAAGSHRPHRGQTDRIAPANCGIAADHGVAAGRPQAGEFALISFSIRPR